MIGQQGGIQYIDSEKLKGIVVTQRDYEKLREANPNEDVITEEGANIQFGNPELRALEPAFAVIVYKKLKHLDFIRSQISNINLVTSMAHGSGFVPALINRVCYSIQQHSDDLSVYIMQVYKPDYSIQPKNVDNGTIATCGDRDINVAGILRDMEISDEISRSADKIYRDGPSVTNMFGLLLKAYNSYSASNKASIRLAGDGTELNDL